MSFARYAIYYTPPPGAFAEFGAAWLGWDIAAGQARAHPAVRGLPLSLAEITEAPRRYGFHATLKPPFRLAGGLDEDQLFHALAALAAQLSPVTLDGLAIAEIDGFLALVPAGDETAVRQLAAMLVEQLDRFRAPPAGDELDRHRAGGLTPRQETMLQRWGYPFVMNQFRFHMTLTGRLGEPEREAVRHVLTPRVPQLLPSTLRIAEVTLAGEDPQGRFHALHRVALSG